MKITPPTSYLLPGKSIWMPMSRAQICHWPTRTQIISAIATLLLVWNGTAASALAQKRDRDKPEPPPPFNLREVKPDPLLPEIPSKRSLSYLERWALSAALDQLNARAAAKLQEGKSIEAFRIWNRELLLRRFLGPLKEVAALNRVGNIALTQNRNFEVQVITGRLQVIKLEAEVQPPVDPALLQALGTTFVGLQARLPAVNIYEQILANARASGDIPARETALKILAELHFGGLNFDKAAPVYEELLALNQLKSDRTIQDNLDDGLYLEQLAFIYDQIKEHLKAIDIRTKLLNRYRQAQDPTLVPLLKIAMGDNYQALGRLATAAQMYQEAYTLAWAIQQFARASEALEKLGELLRSQNKLDEAIQVYEAMLAVEQRGNNTFGMMNAYDRLGQLYLARKTYTRALVAFGQGLEIARQLKYQEDYFTRQIEEVNRQRSP